MGSQSLLKLDSSELQSLRQKESWVPSARCFLGLWFVALGKVSLLPDRALCPLNCQMLSESRKPKGSFHLEQAKELTYSARRPRHIFHLHLTCPSSIPMDFLNFFFFHLYNSRDSSRFQECFLKKHKLRWPQILGTPPKLQLEVVTARIRGGRGTKGGLQRLC